MMEIRAVTRPGSGSSATMKVQEVFILDGTEYDFGTIFEICHYLAYLSPRHTSRITADSSVRSMLLKRKVLAHNDAYEETHPWCRFYRGENFDVFCKGIQKAQNS